MERKTVEVRVPTPPTATGQSTTWGRIVTAVKEKAKTAYDWEGTRLYTGKLVDMQQGEVFISVGSQGSRKYGKKFCSLYVVIDEGYKIMVHECCSDEWPIKMRQTACDYLTLSWEQRCAKALEAEIEWLEDQEQTPKPNVRLMLLREGVQTDFEKKDGDYTMLCAPHDGQWYKAENLSRPAEQVKSESRKALEAEEEAYSKKLAEHAALIAKHKAKLAEFKQPGEGLRVKRTLTVEITSRLRVEVYDDSDLEGLVSSIEQRFEEQLREGEVCFDVEPQATVSFKGALVRTWGQSDD